MSRELTLMLSILGLIICIAVLGIILNNELYPEDKRFTDFFRYFRYLISGVGALQKSSVHPGIAQEEAQRVEYLNRARAAIANLQFDVAIADYNAVLKE